jgi:hypothetical protein
MHGLCQRNARNPGQHPQSPFASSFNGLLIFELIPADGATPLCLFVLAKTLMEYTQSSPGSYVPWVEWGPTKTRLIGVGAFDSCGYRVSVDVKPEAFTGEEPDRNKILDFNPVHVQEFRSGDWARSAQSIEFVAPWSWNQLSLPGVFADDVKTCLPYISIQLYWSPSVVSYMLDVDKIVVVSSILRLVP